MARGGRAAKRKGDAREREFARILSRHLVSLKAVRIPGSGGFSHRGGGEDPAFGGDVQVRRQRDNSTVARIEVKCRDAQKQRGVITIAAMNRWRPNIGRFPHSGILACRQDRGTWLCSVWDGTWDSLCEMAGEEPYVSCVHQNARGVALTEVQAVSIARGDPWILWEGAAYGSVAQLAELLEAAEGEAGKENRHEQ